jgi:hypothetical protein
MQVQEVEVVHRSVDAGEAVVEYAEGLAVEISGIALLQL